MFVTIHVFPILLSMILSVVLGFLWYGPLFGKQWVALSGIVVPENKPCFRDMLKPMLISVLGAFFLALCMTYSIAYAAFFMGTTGIGLGIQAALWNWLGFVVPVQLSFVAWEGKSWKLFMLHAGYWLTFLLLTGILLTMGS